MAIWNPFGKMKKQQADSESAETPGDSDAVSAEGTHADAEPEATKPALAPPEEPSAEKKGGIFSGFKKAIKKTFQQFESRHRLEGIFVMCRYSLDIRT